MLSAPTEVLNKRVIGDGTSTNSTTVSDESSLLPGGNCYVPATLRTNGVFGMASTGGVP